MEQIQMDAMGVQFPYFILISKALQHALDCKHVSSEKLRVLLTCLKLSALLN